MNTPLKNVQQKQTLLKIFIFSLVTAVIWVAFSLFQSQNKTKLPDDILRLAEPLNPNINADVINRIEQKKSYSPGELNNFPVYKVQRNEKGEERIVTQFTSTPVPSPQLVTPTQPAPSSSPSTNIPTEIPANLAQ